MEKEKAKKQKKKVESKKENKELTSYQKKKAIMELSKKVNKRITERAFIDLVLSK